MAQKDPKTSGPPCKKRRKRVFNPGLLALRRGSPAGFGHNRLTELIVTALKKEGPQWYDHIVVPGIPHGLEPVPVRFKHFSPNPDIVISTNYGKSEMWMIHIQRVYPVQRITKEKKVPGDYDKIGPSDLQPATKRRNRQSKKRINRDNKEDLPPSGPAKAQE